MLAMCLFFGQGYEEVARLLTDGLAYARRWQGSWQVPTTAAITRARARLGPEPLRALFAAVCQPLATEAPAPGRSTAGGGWSRCTAPRSTCPTPPPTRASSAGRARRACAGKGAFPQVRVTALAECGTHAIFAAAPGALAVHETELARWLFPSRAGGDAAAR